MNQQEQSNLCMSYVLLHGICWFGLFVIQDDLNNLHCQIQPIIIQRTCDVIPEICQDSANKVLQTFCTLVSCWSYLAEHLSYFFMLWTRGISKIAFQSSYLLVNLVVCERGLNSKCFQPQELGRFFVAWYDHHGCAHILHYSVMTRKFKGTHQKRTKQFIRSVLIYLVSRCAWSGFLRWQALSILFLLP